MDNSPRSTIVVELFGDLDLTLVSFVAETLDDVARSGARRVVLSRRGLAMSSGGALRALEHTVAAARACGTTVEIIPGNRKMRRTPGTCARHVILARHAIQGELDRSA